MDIFIQIGLSFLGTACFGVIFNVPIKAIPWCGIVGTLGWTIFHVLSQEGVYEVHASFVGAFVVAIVAYIYARRLRMPMIVFSVSGIIPLVPGGIAYNAMRSVVEVDYLTGMQYGMRAFLISGAIAMGLVFAEVIMQLMFRFMRKGRTSIQSFVKEKKATKMPPKKTF
ncbi:threonine/serine exporter family protein [Lysinibacillus sp. LZ02]|uniref:threonine/serine exporter family protein n=1 Tax=Lysinibacillus sp. LZ02 TaxID=3420668 RepID=UPI003D36E0D3